LNAIKKKTVEGLCWDFAACETLDPYGYSCRMFQQDVRLFSFETHETKKPLLGGL